MRTILVVALTIIFCIGCSGMFAVSQQQGQIVLTVDGTQGGVYYVTWPNGQLMALGIPYPQTFDASAIKVPHNQEKNAPSNSETFYIGENDGKVQRVSLNRQTRIATLPQKIRGIALDQNRSYLITCGTSVYRLTGTSAQPIANGLSGLGPICRDGDTGNFLIGCSGDFQNSSRLLWVDRVSGQTSLLANIGNTMGGIYGIAHLLQAEGDFAVTARLGRTGPFGLFIVDRSNGSILRTINGVGSGAVTVHHKTGNIFVANSNGSVYECTPQGQIVQSRQFSVTGVTGIDVCDDQNVSVTADGGQLEQVRVDLRFTRSALKQYVAALALSPRPGIRLGNETINLAPDGLFFLTVGGLNPYWTTGFAGTMDGNGEAVMHFVNPWMPGIRIHVAAAAKNSAFANHVDIGNTEVIAIP